MPSVVTHSNQSYLNFNDLADRYIVMDYWVLPALGINPFDSEYFNHKTMRYSLSLMSLHTFIPQLHAMSETQLCTKHSCETEVTFFICMLFAIKYKRHLLSLLLRCYLYSYQATVMPEDPIHHLFIIRKNWCVLCLAVTAMSLFPSNKRQRTFLLK